MEFSTFLFILFANSGTRLVLVISRSGDYTICITNSSLNPGFVVETTSLVE